MSLYSRVAEQSVLAANWLRIAWIYQSPDVPELRPILWESLCELTESMRRRDIQAIAGGGTQ